MKKLLLVLPHPHGLHLHLAPLALGVKRVLCIYIYTHKFILLISQAMHFGRVSWDIAWMTTEGSLLHFTDFGLDGSRIVIPSPSQNEWL